MKRGTPDHPKTLELADRLGLERWGAVGLLECLWHFAAHYAKRGDVGRFSDEAIARAMMASRLSTIFFWKLGRGYPACHIL